MTNPSFHQQSYLNVLSAPYGPVTSGEGQKIDVNAALSRFAFFYEHLRRLIDYQDEHLLRRAAIDRVLKRQLMLETNTHEVANYLVRELIAARYVPNGEIPESVVVDIERLIQKYQAIQICRVGSKFHLTWLRKILSVEIEEHLFDSTRDKELAAFLYDRLKLQMEVVGAKLSEREIHLQLYIAVLKTLFKADDHVLGYKLIRAFVPEWKQSDAWVANAQPMAERLVGVERRIRLTLKHPIQLRMGKVVHPWAVSLRLMTDAILGSKKSPEELVKNGESLTTTIRSKAEEYYDRTKQQLRRGAIRAILYILITKMALAVAIEVPIEHFFYSSLSPITLGVNLMFPPVLMFIVTLFIHAPKEDNTERIVQHARALLDAKDLDVRKVVVKPKRSGVDLLMFQGTYLLSFLLIFGGIYEILHVMHFNAISSLIFLFFLCTVSFFGFRLRARAREWRVVEGRERLRTLLLDFFSLPILRVGQGLSQGISKINVFLFIFDVLLEAPFKILLRILEEWFAYLKERKEEIQQ